MKLTTTELSAVIGTLWQQPYNKVDWVIWYLSKKLNEAQIEIVEEELWQIVEVLQKVWEEPTDNVIKFFESKKEKQQEQEEEQEEEEEEKTWKKE